ncbi:hypothetical protein A3H89_03685 [Candidatus Amesbacteria bacterium RIFCSPLOWO2_02_FULL_48_11]|uniref:Uncharacterized protein n=1 Tax=Candidatus Amesbacteria bacterium RIFCSPHIGHO2_12_FULL_48_14 TaxID=1797257 RepID=A0A1F4Z780_9BACT|nr:MAG: hypothetical protein A2V48_03480 [Candidatus Amesbacteria bacterium RBG_19FT_COMBO_48_16]OGC95948.1 MAG: hypothetical protein A3C34_02100 [Candidatus Amesbacteria bacterium RIFCSPHIGHO2_02_FULL_48_21]OGD01478.1 MAG: hypothetical protein A2354_00585 [Candidatus Amesbacteria bacterium RIFOXYB1_FULL_47_12]OGD01847.1 MAG: hypothetical protein A3E17_04055 [Candidatus Amesbacteria bacterium RIFCSPHIGHO2_12_FULL_48_14]OGD07369.1 MAG: hypothetical protein A3H89_03685 [Candidatus Amesbacteria ba
MPSLVLIVALIVLAVGIVFRPSAKDQVLGQQEQRLTNPTPAITPAPSPFPTSVPIRKPTSARIPTNTSIPIPPPDLSSWVYPGSQLVSSGVWQTSDSPDTVTSWYRNKIEALNLTATSFVKTSANDRVLNRLVAEGFDVKVDIEISRSDNSSFTRIRITLDNS